jgi:hypothetical protein
MLAGIRILGSLRHCMIGLAAVAVFGAIAAQPGRASVLQNEWCINPPATSSTCGETAQVQSGPITNTVGGSYQFDQGSSSSGTMTDVSSYGNLFASGSGMASNSVYGGANVSAGPYIGGAPVAMYSDTLTITGTGPVSLQFTEVFSGGATFSPGYDDYASISDVLNVNGPGGGWIANLTSSGTATKVLTYDPGEQIGIVGALFASGGVFPDNIASPPSSPAVTLSFSYEGSGPLYIDVLTPGGGYYADSGTEYPTSAPEPASLLLLGAGLAGVAALGTSRKPC